MIGAIHKQDTFDFYLVECLLGFVFIPHTYIEEETAFRWTDVYL